MKKDVLDFAEGREPQKILSKETLNNPELIYMASGINPLENTKNAYLKAYETLGIDFVNRVPLENCPPPLKNGEKKKFDNNYMLTYLGLYDSYVRCKYPYNDVDDFLDSGKTETLDYYLLHTPVPHELNLLDISKREAALGDRGMYYCQLYTTLFMWGIEYLGWEVSMMAIALDPDKYDKKFLGPAFEITKRLTSILLKAQSPYIFFHDDLATSTGLVCRKQWMERYLFPRYKKLFEYVHKNRKKVIFVTDGNVKDILSNIKACNVDGVMLESPATPLQEILDCFDKELVIGGIDTNILMIGDANSVEKHVLEIAKKTEGKCFAYSVCGGIHGNMPVENLERYFDVRGELKVNGINWRQIHNI